jgi:hypothetical protein
LFVFVSPHDLKLAQLRFVLKSAPSSRGLLSCDLCLWPGIEELDARPGLTCSD